MMMMTMMMMYLSVSVWRMIVKAMTLNRLTVTLMMKKKMKKLVKVKRVC